MTSLCADTASELRGSAVLPSSGELLSESNVSLAARALDAGKRGLRHKLYYKFAILHDTAQLLPIDFACSSPFFLTSSSAEVRSYNDEGFTPPRKDAATPRPDPAISDRLTPFLGLAKALRTFRPPANDLYSYQLRP